ncbi:hypothetical protein LPJ66_008018 [Kickxella alabastrina]|uniref:Uncharacterized protein n=1 Tax=Kickxella alabastrina TaxID=61397 RepID=A0ACC1IB15_9FUNG|nr:hypothetical protein LPJ66_008018 [Kickxella alabastrina]
MGTYQLDETLVKETCVVTAPLVPRLSTDSASELTPLVGRDVESTVVEVEQRSIRDLLTPTVLRVMTTNALMCMSVSMSDQLYPIFAATKPSDGGLGFEFRKIGYSLAISGIAVLYVQLIAYPKLALKHGVLFCYQTGMKILVPVFIAIPFLSLLADKVKSTINVAVPDASPLLSLPAISTAWGAVSLDYCLLWALLTFLLLARIAGDVLAFTSINLITANVAPSRADLGFMNGAQQMAMSFTRILGPLVSGTAWSWSIKHSLPFPFNSHFAWMLCALLMAVASYMSHSLPNSVNKFAADNHTRAGNNEISNSNAE